MPHPVSLDDYFQEAMDLHVLLGKDRRLEACNGALTSTVPQGRAGTDFLDLVAEGSRPPAKAALARAAGGHAIYVTLDVAAPGASATSVAWHFWPVAEGRVAGLGRVQARPGDAATAGREGTGARRRQERLDRIELELTQVPFVDPGTGLWNGVQFFDRLAVEWQRALRYGSPLALLVVEVHGVADLLAEGRRAAAEDLMAALALRLRRGARGHEILGRQDDRFLAGIDADVEGARGAAQRIQAALEKDPVIAAGEETPVRVVVAGASNRSTDVEDLEDLFPVAEAALRVAREGPRRIHVAG